MPAARGRDRLCRRLRVPHLRGSSACLSAWPCRGAGAGAIPTPTPPPSKKPPYTAVCVDDCVHSYRPNVVRRLALRGWPWPCHHLACVRHPPITVVSQRMAARIHMLLAASAKPPGASILHPAPPLPPSTLSPRPPFRATKATPKAETSGASSPVHAPLRCRPEQRDCPSSSRPPSRPRPLALAARRRGLLSATACLAAQRPASLAAHGSHEKRGKQSAQRTQRIEPRACSDVGLQQNVMESGASTV